LKGTTKGTDILEATKTTLARYHLSLKNPAGLAIDGAPAMVGTMAGLVAQEQEIDTSTFTSYHCIIHHENLCAKSLGFENVMKVITDIVNFIRAKGLNHRQFQNFLQTEWDADHVDVVYFSDVRRLSRSKVLTMIYGLKHAIQYLGAFELRHLRCKGKSSFKMPFRCLILLLHTVRQQHMVKYSAICCVDCIQCIPKLMFITVWDDSVQQAHNIAFGLGRSPVQAYLCSDLDSYRREMRSKTRNILDNTSLLPYTSSATQLSYHIPNTRPNTGAKFWL
jgi:hypothetical protein